MWWSKPKWKHGEEVQKSKKEKVLALHTLWAYNLLHLSLAGVSSFPPRPARASLPFYSALSLATMSEQRLQYENSSLTWVRICSSNISLNTWNHGFLVDFLFEILGSNDFRGGIWTIQFPIVRKEWGGTWWKQAAVDEQASDQASDLLLLLPDAWGESGRRGWLSCSLESKPPPAGGVAGGCICVGSAWLAGEPKPV